MTSSNERLEDITISSENDTAIIYIQDGVEKSIAIEQVSAILYDNGKYVEFAKRHPEFKLDVTDSVEIVEFTNIDTENIDIYTIDIDACTYLSASEKGFLKHQIKLIRNLKMRKQTASNLSKIVGREVYITTYLQARAQGVPMFKADLMAQGKVFKEYKNSHANQSIKTEAK